MYNADMVFAKTELLKLINEGRIKVEPFTEDQVGAASIDLALGDEFRVFKKQDRAYRIEDKSNYKDVTEVVRIAEGKSFLLQPGETILGITQEKITLPTNISGRLEGRSRYARLGLTVHISSSFVQPGVSNKQVLEISNLGQTTLELIPGVRVCHLVLEEVKGEGKYTGAFQNQDTI